MTIVIVTIEKLNTALCELDWGSLDSQLKIKGTLTPKENG